ncbi:hypothetical protein K525DRAFT_202954 [Schizophyllum commune Loenen D]|nr:hypothetical protein K525DRAFT_202954 [Schizophyllum commune Loenen D]
MVETLLSQYRRSFLLCHGCDDTCHVELDLPPPGPENTILRTGRHLSTAETERIGQTIARTDECLQRLSAKVEDLLARVAQLRDGERELKELRKVQEAYLAPVRKLPPEILSIIFKMYCGEKSVDLLQKECSPLILSSVCKVWRDTMLALHSAWNHFKFSPYGMFAAARSEILLNRLRTFLDYSGDRPLRHCVRFNLDPLASRKSKRTAPLDLLIAHAHRWTDVEFVSQYGISEGERALLGKLDGQRLLRLQKLNGDVEALVACSAMGLFEGLTTLRSVTLRGAPHHLEHTTVALDLPWEAIDELTTHLPCKYALPYVQRCSNLVEWHYSDISRYGVQGVRLPDSPIVLPRLRTLFVRFSHESDAAVLHHTTMPALQECRLIYDSSSRDSATDIGFAALLARSACPLRRLTLEYPPRSVLDTVYNDTLQGLEFLSVRAGNNAPLTKAFIDMLGTPDSAGKPRLLPLLADLELGGEPEGFKASALVKMGQARLRMGYPLKRFVLDAVLMGMSSYTFEWSDEIEWQMSKVVGVVEVRGRHNIMELSPSP